LIDLDDEVVLEANLRLEGSRHGQDKGGVGELEELDLLNELYIEEERELTPKSLW